MAAGGGPSNALRFQYLRRKFGALGKEPIARMYGISFRLKDRLDVQVTTPLSNLIHRYPRRIGRAHVRRIAVGVE